jgi:nucleolysin TIA-1/TIAR
METLNFFRNRNYFVHVSRTFRSLFPIKRLFYFCIFLTQLKQRAFCVVSKNVFFSHNFERSTFKASCFPQVYNQSSPTNCTVYCGGFTNGLTEELMQKTFAQFGVIQDIRVFKDKGYAFIKFATKESATHAIETVHNTEINGHMVKCFWGKENGGMGADPGAMTSGAAVAPGTQAQPYPYGYGGYWYQGYGGYMQGYPYQQYQYQQQYCMMPQQGQWTAQPGQQPNVPVMYSTVQKYPSQ